MLWHETRLLRPLEYLPLYLLEETTLSKSLLPLSMMELGHQAEQRSIQVFEVLVKR